jgi:predicted MPP superfamily phosphohydrolase
LICPRLPAAFDGYRILQLSDLHMSHIGRREEILNHAIAGVGVPDLIAMTGDLIHTPRGIQPFLELAAQWRANDGIYAIFGNSEHKNGVRAPSFASALAGRGIVPLLNCSIRLDRGGESIYLLGVDDPVSGYDLIDKATQGVPHGCFQLLLMHSPDSVGLAVAHGIDLVLSGHTHGGQIKLPLIGPLHTHSHLGLSMSNGLYGGKQLHRLIGFRPGRTRLYVTRGIGVSGLAIRFLCRPEISVITLRSPHALSEKD